MNFIGRSTTFPTPWGRTARRTAIVRLGFRGDDEFSVAGPVPEETVGRMLEQ